MRPKRESYHEEWHAQRSRGNGSRRGVSAVRTRAGAEQAKRNQDRDCPISLRGSRTARCICGQHSQIIDGAVQRRRWDRGCPSQHHLCRRSRVRCRQSCGISSTRPGRKDHYCDRLYVERQLSRRRPSRRRAQDADHLSRVRQLSANRQGSPQIRVPHRCACGIRECQCGALRPGHQARISRPLRA